MIIAFKVAPQFVKLSLLMINEPLGPEKANPLVQFLLRCASHWMCARAKGELLAIVRERLILTVQYVPEVII